MLYLSEFYFPSEDVEYNFLYKIRDTCYTTY